MEAKEAEINQPTSSLVRLPRHASRLNLGMARRHSTRGCPPRRSHFGLLL